MSGLSPGRGRRLAGLAGLLGACILAVVGKAASAPAHTTVALGPAPGAGPSAAPPSSAPPSAAGPSSAAPAQPTGATATVTGRPEDVGYGIVQVRVVLTNGKITDVQAVSMPSGGRSSEITAYAGPKLREEVLAAQSAQIDTVSGASFTSEGYARSVQSALDAAPR